MWPINKLKAIFQSIDAQLKAIQENQDELQQNITSVHEKAQQNITIVNEKAQLDIQKNKEQLEQIQMLYSQQIDEVKKSTEQLSEYIAEAKQQLALLNQDLSQNSKLLTEHRQDKLNDHWMTKYGYDELISNLQLSITEQKVHGNRFRLEALKDSHIGESCFVIGNGPSLTVEDLDKLKQANIFCFAAKRINKIFTQTQWRPDVWGVSDLGFINEYKKEISDLSGFIKIAPCQTIVNLDIELENTIYFPFIQAERTPCWFNKDVTKGVHFWGTITCKLINFAVYMGFTKIYLLGVDHTIPVITDENGEKRFDENVKLHFSNDYFDTKEVSKKLLSSADVLDKTYQYTTIAYKDVGCNCKDLGVEIFNCTRAGKLEAFPRKDLETVVKEII